MIEIRAVVPDALGAPLEDFFCAEVRSPWVLLRARPSDPLLLSGYFDDETAARIAWAELCVAFPEVTPEPEVIPVADEDWKLAYRHHLTYWSCGNLHWVPVWERETRQLPDGSAAIYIDSGMAFGTGSHETTRLCAKALMEFLARRAPAAVTVTDAGCGSGILALSAARLGCPDAFGFDRDPESTRISGENAAENNLTGPCRFATGGIEDFLPQRTADCVLANIQADVLRIYSEELLDAVLPGGWLILSGILAREVDAVARHFSQAAGDRLSHPPVCTIDGEWASVVLQDLS